MNLSYFMHVIGGKFKRRPLFTPKSEGVRPTTAQLRETVFNICQLSIEEARFLDLFAGSAAMGIEALSRGASHATFVENNRLALAAIKKNITSLQLGAATTVLPFDAFKAIQHLYDEGHQFEIVYADPPYGRGFGALLLEFLDRHSLLVPGGLLFIEDTELHLPKLQRLKLQTQRRVGRAHLYTFHFIGVE